MADRRWNRRRVLSGAVTALGALWASRQGVFGLLVPPARAAPTPACDDGDETLPQTAGPFYTPESPAKPDMRADGPGDPVTLTGRVVDTHCRPIPGAIVDLWHADAQGRYDNEGYRFRGHTRAGPDGEYRFETVLPGRYGRRTRHYHVRIATPDRPMLTTQLYFPDEPANARDWLYREELLMAMEHSSGITIARFEFVLPAA